MIKLFKILRLTVYCFLMLMLISISNKQKAISVHAATTDSIIVEANSLEYFTFTEVGSNGQLFGYSIKQNSASTPTGDIVLPSDYLGYPVLHIDESAFKNNIQVTSVTIPDSYTIIGQSAFSGCTNLVEVKLGSNIQRIRSNAFNGCTNLSIINIPDSIEEISSQVFMNCTSLSNIDFPNKDIVFGTGLFRNCTALVKLVIPDEVTSLPQAIFQGCTNLKELTLPFVGDALAAIVTDTTNHGTLGFLFGQTGSNMIEASATLEKITITKATTLYKDAFYNTSSLKEVILPDTLTKINESAFKNCTDLESIFIPEGVTEIKDYAFDGCTGLLNISLPDTLVSLGSYAFLDCSSLESINIPKNVTKLNTRTFSNCIKLKDLIFDEDSSLTSIGLTPFNNCPSIVQLELPVSIESFDAGCLAGLINLEEITLPFVGLTPTSSKSAAGDAYYGSFAVLFTTKNTFTYPSSLKKVVFLEGCESVNDYAFNKCATLEEVVLPSTIKKIEENAFSECSAFVSINFPEGLEVIEANAFYKCTSLSVVNLPSTLRTIKTNAFAYCSSIEDLVLPNVLTILDSGSLSYMTKLNKIVIPETITAISSNLLKGCNSLKEVEFPKGLTSVAMGVLNGCTSLEKITTSLFYTGSNKLSSMFMTSDTSISSSIYPTNLIEVNYTGPTSLASKAFQFCESLITVNVIEEQTTLPTYLFDGCSSLLNLNYHGSYDAIGDYAFQGCSSLEYIDLNDTYTSIGINSFKDCAKITSFVVPVTVTKIGKSAFDGCRKLKEIIIPDSVTSMGAGMFFDCVALEKVKLSSGTTNDTQLFRNNNALKELIMAYNFTSSQNSFSVMFRNPTTTSTGIENMPESLKEVTFDKFIAGTTASLMNGAPFIERIVFPEGLKQTGASSFANMPKLKYVEFSSTVTTIATSTFTNDTALEVIKIKAVTAPTAPTLTSCTALKTVYVPLNSMASYQSKWTAVSSKINPFAEKIYHNDDLSGEVIYLDTSIIVVDVQVLLESNEYKIECASGIIKLVNKTLNEDIQVFYNAGWILTNYNLPDDFGQVINISEAGFDLFMKSNDTSYQFIAPKIWMENLTLYWLSDLNYSNKYYFEIYVNGSLFETLIKDIDEEMSYTFASLVDIDEISIKQVEKIPYEKYQNSELSNTINPKIVYKVSFYTDTNTLIKTVNLKSGSYISYINAPEKVSDDENKYYVFDSWSTNTEYVSSNMYIFASYLLKNKFIINFYIDNELVDVMGKNDFLSLSEWPSFSTPGKRLVGFFDIPECNVDCYLSRLQAQIEYGLEDDFLNLYAYTVVLEGGANYFGATTVYKNANSVLSANQIYELVKGNFSCDTPCRISISKDNYTGFGATPGTYLLQLKYVSEANIEVYVDFDVIVVKDIAVDYFYDNEFYITTKTNLNHQAFVNTLKRFDYLPDIAMNYNIYSSYFDDTTKAGIYDITVSYSSTSGLDNLDDPLSLELHVQKASDYTQVEETEEEVFKQKLLDFTITLMITLICVVVVLFILKTIFKLIKKVV